METIQIDPSTTPLTEHFEQEKPKPAKKSHNKHRRYDIIKPFFFILIFTHMHEWYEHTHKIY